jgi:hypothetical protein
MPKHRPSPIRRILKDARGHLDLVKDCMTPEPLHGGFDGLLANRTRAENLALCRQLLAADGAAVERSGSAACASYEHRAECPACKKGHLIFIALVPPSRAGPGLAIPTVYCA